MGGGGTSDGARPTAPFGPANPHPLSQLRSELVWEGKYDEYGNRRPVDVAGAIPLQRIEKIDEPRARAEAQGGLFDSTKAHMDDFRNLLVWGDNKLAMASLMADYRGKVDLIYIDPPFDVGADFSLRVPIGDAMDQVVKDQSALEVVAYRDTWGRGADSYLSMLYERLVLMRDLLSETGSIYIHVGPGIVNYVKVMADDIFGAANAVSEIVWKRQTAHSDAKSYATLHEVLLFYRKGPDAFFETQYIPYSEKHLRENYRYEDERGRFALGQMKAPGNRGPKYEWNGITRHWRYTRDNMQVLHDEGHLYYSQRPASPGRSFT
jgi:adenine-specific DNA-methyltransferase